MCVKGQTGRGDPSGEGRLTVTLAPLGIAEPLQTGAAKLPLLFPKALQLRAPGWQRCLEKRWRSAAFLPARGLTLASPWPDSRRGGPGPSRREDERVGIRGRLAGWGPASARATHPSAMGCRARLASPPGTGRGGLLALTMQVRTLGAGEGALP